MDELGFEPIEDDLGFEELGFEPEESQPDAPAEPEMGWGEYIGRGTLDAIPYAGMAGGAVMGATAGPVTGVAGGGLGYAMGSEVRDYLKNKMFGDELPSTEPMDQLDRSASNIATGATAQMGGQVLSAAGSVIPKAAETFATSPIPKKVADATNVVQHGRGMLSNFLPKGPVSDMVTGAIGRKAAYSNPLTGLPQGVSDSSRAVQGVQKGTAWLLDHTPEVFGKFAPVLKEAAQRGGGALATTEFLLAQKDPEFQELMKKQREN